MKKILILDNDPFNADNIKELLDFEDVKTLAVYTIEQLKQRILAFAPHVMVLNIKLKKCDGSALCRSLKTSQLHSKIKIILISTQNTILKNEMLIGCFDDFLEKPFTAEELIEKVFNILHPILGAA